MDNNFSEDDLIKAQNFLYESTDQKNDFLQRLLLSKDFEEAEFFSCAWAKISKSETDFYDALDAIYNLANAYKKHEDHDKAMEFYRYIAHSYYGDKEDLFKMAVKEFHELAKVEMNQGALVSNMNMLILNPEVFSKTERQEMLRECLSNLKTIANTEKSVSLYQIVISYGAELFDTNLEQENIASLKDILAKSGDDTSTQEQAIKVLVDNDKDFMSYAPQMAFEQIKQDKEIGKNFYTSIYCCLSSEDGDLKDQFSKAVRNEALNDNGGLENIISRIESYAPTKCWKKSRTF